MVAERMMERKAMLPRRFAVNASKACRNRSETGQVGEVGFDVYREGGAEARGS